MKDLWRENLRQLFLDFIDLGEDEEAWKINLGIYDDLLAEVKRLRGGIISILSVYDINDLIREVPEDEWNFEQQALIRLKELIECT